MPRDARGLDNHHAFRDAMSPRFFHRDTGVETMACLPPMTGNGNHSTYKNGDDWGLVYMLNIW